MIFYLNFERIIKILRNIRRGERERERKTNIESQKHLKIYIRSELLRRYIEMDGGALRSFLTVIMITGPIFSHPSRLLSPSESFHR